MSLSSKDTRIRGRQLQAIRQAHRERSPLCTHCEEAGRVRLWTQLDHITPLGKGGQDVESNRQGLCDPCHEKKTQQEFGHTKRRRFDVDGNPVG